MNDTRLPDLSPGDESAVRGLYHRVLDGWNLRDGAAFAGPFAQDGEAIGFDGSRHVGRSGIAAEVGRVLAEHETPAYVAKVRRVRPLAAGAAQLDAVAGLVPPGAEDIDPVLNALHTVIAVNRGAGWRIALLQNTPARYDGRPDLARALTAELRELLVRTPGPVA
ncbi:SgcJ/EcaC family oxidoreductase [Kitasatospora sp. NPDC057015]|uniref:SgcJ/EcaC family oxidoreductase n=1 Tax=Kitasatospora sp. NPDC057015 TaxID=3346001 RepID=UPI0036419087